jgi:hypothetical protein
MACNHCQQHQANMRQMQGNVSAREPHLKDIQDGHQTTQPPEDVHEQGNPSGVSRLVPMGGVGDSSVQELADSLKNSLTEVLTELR